MSGAAGRARLARRRPAARRAGGRGGGAVAGGPAGVHVVSWRGGTAVLRSWRLPVVAAAYLCGRARPWWGPPLTARVAAGGGAGAGVGAGHASLAADLRCGREFPSCVLVTCAGPGGSRTWRGWHLCGADAALFAAQLAGRLGEPPPELVTTCPGGCAAEPGRVARRPRGGPGCAPVRDRREGVR